MALSELIKTVSLKLNVRVSQDGERLLKNMFNPLFTSWSPVTTYSSLEPYINQLPNQLQEKAKSNIKNWIMTTKEEAGLYLIEYLLAEVVNESNNTHLKNRQLSYEGFIPTSSGINAYDIYNTIHDDQELRHVFSNYVIQFPFSSTHVIPPELDSIIDDGFASAMDNYLQAYTKDLQTKIAQRVNKNKINTFEDFVAIVRNS